MLISRKVSLGFVVVLLVAGFVAAQDIPVRNWEVPRGDLAKNAVVPPNPFAAISPPCRLSDSRVTSGGPGPIPGSGTRDYDFIPGGSSACGALPANVVALSVYFTVVNPLGPGFLFAFPAGSPPATATSIINYNGTPGELRNNAAIVPVNPATGSFAVGTGVSGTDLIIDINGVFYSNLEASHQLSIVADYGGGAAILGVNTSTTPGSHAVGGFANGGLVHGVRGHIGAMTGEGSSGVYGISESGAETSAGVFGESANQAPAGHTYGVRAMNLSTNANGVALFAKHAGGGRAVYGESATGNAIVGIAGGPSTTGITGIAGGPNGLGVHGIALVANGTGVFFDGGLVGSGTKAFIEPHPTNPALAIKYVSLEGPEAGTYFRGRAKFSQGLARITVPETFRMVTAEEGLTIQVTPMGEMASVAVVRLDLDEIVVKGSRNVEFCYTVNGVRRAYPDWNPITSSEPAFQPKSRHDRLPAYLSEEERLRLIRNGTYQVDGSVNLETAKRLGWDKGWAKTQPASVP